MPRPTMRDVARLSGVSVASVSYALNPRADRPLSEQMVARVTEAARSLGYVPNASAAALRRGHTDLLLIALDATFVGDVSERSNRALVDAASDRGFTPLVYNVESDEALVRIAEATRPVAVLHLAFLSPQVRERLRHAGATYVLGFQRSATEPEPVAARFWEVEIGKTQAQHLVARGYRRLMYVAPAASPRLPVAASREHGFRLACDDLGVEVLDTLRVEADCSDLPGKLALSEAVAARTGVCAFDDRIALGVLAAASDLGLATPACLGVIGADGTVESALVRPSLSTVLLDGAANERLATFWLDAALRGESDAAALADGRLHVRALQRQST